MAQDEATSFWLHGSAHAPQEAREEFMRQDLRLPDAKRHDALLLLTELVSNAVRHGSARDRLLCVEIARLRRRIRVSVTDPGDGFDWPSTVAADSRPGGYGLLLVDRIALGWGAERREDSTTVWFELGLSW